MNSRVLAIFGGLAVIGVIVLIVTLLHKTGSPPQPEMTLYPATCGRIVAQDCNASSRSVMGYIKDGSSTAFPKVFGRLDNANLIPSWMDPQRGVNVEQLIWNLPLYQGDGDVKVVLSDIDSRTPGDKVEMTLTNNLGDTKTYTLILVQGSYSGAYAWGDVGVLAQGSTSCYVPSSRKLTKNHTRLSMILFGLSGPPKSPFFEIIPVLTSPDA